VTAPIHVLKACLNGGRSAADHPGVPLTPEALAEAAARAVAAGAEAVHVHPRDEHGRESLDPDDVAAAVAAIRGACPGVPVGVTTGLWVTDGDPHARMALVEGWREPLPDFASVNVSEPGFDDLADLLQQRGVAVEAGVWSVADARQLAGRGPQGIARILVEVMDARREDAVAEAEAILNRLDAVGLTVPRLLHGEGDACWPLVAEAGRRGLPTRIGLEDTVTGPAGEPVADNAALVRLALEVWNQHASR